MANLTQQLKTGAESAFGSLSQGWRDLRARAGEAMTRFLPQRGAARDESDDDGERVPVVQRWGLMAADVFEDDRNVVVRLEAPGMRKDDFRIELNGSLLTVRGEKRYEREQSRGSWHVRQCAYGSFTRTVELPVEVDPDRCAARYRDGVLRVELAKTARAARKRIAVPVH